TKTNAFDAPKSLQEGLNRYQVNMTRGAQKLFLERIGEDYSRLQNELEKLSLLDTQIDEHLINQMITRDISRDIFALGNALLNKEHNTAFQIYHSLLEQRNDPLNLAPLVASSLRTIYQVETLNRLGYSQSAIMDSLKISKGQYWVVMNRQVGKVKNILPLLNDLSNLDQKAKLGEIDRFVAFEMFMLDMMK
ncbi:MAG TPA: DNA polymerase III subunit delta, partial [Erysipelothrix sp.]|nr:DNA polymerase III subunit delta [Erysipelothrix sp.]